jgi:hypothetical protein
VDFDNAQWGIGRDLDEVRTAGVFGWILISLLFGLPALSLLVTLFRSLLALVPLAASGAVFGLWFLYYATDWFANPGQAARMPAMLLIVCGWIVLLVAVVRPSGRGLLPRLLRAQRLGR